MSFRVLEAGSSINDPETKTVIMFHGFGANAADLYPLHSEIKARHSKIRWLFPEGPVDIPMGWMTGKAWWPIDMVALQRAIESGEPRVFPEEMKLKARKMAGTMTTFLNSKSIDWSRTYVGGFSQGAMLATELALSLEVQPAGLILFSGGYLDESRWPELARKMPGLRYFQSHGRFDPVLAHDSAERMATCWDQSGWNGVFHSFSGGHEIPVKIMAAVGEFII